MNETKNMKNSELVKRFIPYYKPFIPTLIFDLLCATLTSIGALVLPPIVSSIINKAQNDISSLTPEFITKVGVLYVALRIIDSLAYYYMATTGHIMGVKLEANMRMDLFTHLQTLPLSYYNTTKIGQLMARITSDLFDITEFAHHCPEEFWIAALKFTVSFIILININVPLTVILFVMVPIMYLGTRYFNKRMRKAFKDSRHHVGEINSKVEDSLLGVRVVQSFANESNEIKHFGEYNDEFVRIKKKAYKYMGGFHTVTQLFDGLMYIIVIVIGAFLLINGSISAGDYVAYVLYVSTLLTVVKVLVQYTEQFQRGMTGIERFFEIMDVESDITDSPNAIKLSNVKGDIEFKNVSFRYDEKNPKVFSNISEKVPAGTSIALVGPSGGGKTTLVNLLPRFYDVTDGTIEIDGINIKDIKISSLRGNIGMVQQDVYLFSSTVFDNIQYGKP
ncbi:MAG: ABC transporter ATP-binding protein, partial [Christensenellaceae bacterium]|nr:ABC transporter ATP-binding protein [Christensenellaceae bacterium]